jgi:tRNA-Thr(GGU) m(6)t(6)A37 methyltransferase TsaA
MLERMRETVRRWFGREEGPPVEELPMASFEPIAVVRNRVKEPRMGGWESVESRIVVRESLAGALDGLEGFSHLMVIFWCHLVTEEARVATHIHPRGDPELPVQGVFATRTQLRPNPIGLSIVPLLSREGNVLRVRGLDAINGTPVLDVKPYVANYDSLPEATMPAWVEALSHRHANTRAADAGDKS